MGKAKSLVSIILVLGILVTMTGCWDSVEINQRSFVLGLGADLYDPSTALEGEMEEGREPADESDKPKILATFVFPKQVTALSGPSPGETQNVSISSVGENIFIIRRHLATRTDTDLFLGHLKVILMGEDLVKNRELFIEFLDGAEKQSAITRRISFGVVEGTAKEALAVSPKLEPNTGQFVTDLLTGADRTGRAPMLDMNQVLISLHTNGNVLIPKVVAKKDELKVGGSAIIKDFTFVGWLGELETLCTNILQNRVKVYGIDAKVDGVIIPFDVSSSKTRYKLETSGDHMRMVIDIMGEADIEIFNFAVKNDLLDPTFLDKVQHALNEEMTQLAVHTIEVLQKEYRVDVLGFDSHISKFHPKIWKRIKGDWENIYPDLEVVVNTKIELRRIGLAH